MSIKYGFFNSVDGDRKYNAEDLGRYLQGLISSGVYADRSDSLQVLANGDLTVTVQPGRAMLDCHYLENDEPLVLTLAPGGAMDRFDAVVMRLDLAERTCSIYVKQGTPATEPIKPMPSRLDNAKEWTLAYVYVKKLTTTITQASVTDTRSDNVVCGWVTGLITQMDTSTLFAQMEAALEEKAATFDTWMAGLADAVPFQESAEHPGCLCRIQDGETEWLNPPMEKDVEYRTTKRNNGSPVYVKRIAFNEWTAGDLFSSNRMQIDVAPHMQTLVSVSGNYVVGGPSGGGAFYHLIPGSTVDVEREGTYPTNPIFITVNSAQTLRSLSIDVEYTK